MTVIGTLLLSVAWGQTSGTLSGKITAADGSPVPGASVMITDSTGFARSTVAAQDGTFSIQNLPPGSYRVQVESSGFKRLSQENVQVMPGTPVNLQLGLETGSNRETVEVEGHAPLAQDQDAQVAHSYTGRIVSELPVLDLNHEQLVELMTGITPPAATNSILIDPQRSRTWNTNGQQALANNTLLDGVENLEPEHDIAVHVSTINDIQQMNLVTSDYRAENGRALGSILFPNSRPGTNGWHGDAFEYHNDSWLKARNYFDPSGLPQPVSAMNQFGGAVGGAIVPDKTFLFLSDEGDLNRDATPTYTTVPGTAFAMGNFSSLPPGGLIYNPFTGPASGVGRTPFANNTIPSNLINPAAESILSSLPAPNLSGFVNNYFANVPFRNYGLRTEARVDQHFNDNNLLFLRYALSYYTTSQQSALGALGADAGESRLRAHDALIGYTHAFGATTFTNIRVGYTRYSDPIYALNNPGLASAYGLTGLSGNLPAISIDGMLPIGSNATYPQLNKEDTWNGANNWTMRIGNNDLRFGLDYWQIRADGFQNLLYGPLGGYSFSAGATTLPGSTLGPFASYANSLAAFLLGTPSAAGVASSNYLPSYLSRQYGAYVSDHINIMSHLSIDLGLRYDYFWPIEPRSNAASYSVYQPGTDTLVPLGANGISRTGGVASNNLNFAPRVGIAYRVNDRTVIRTGYGITYWNPGLPYFSSALIPSTTGLVRGTTSGYGIGGTFGVLPAMTTGTTAPNETYYVTPSQVRTPYVQFYTFNVQQDVTHGILFDIGYVGNLGRELPYTQDLNAALPGAGAVGQAFYRLGQTAPVYLRGTGYNSNYNSLQANITKRFSQGIAFTAAYTYSKSLDYGEGLTPFLNNNNPAANYGPSNFDRTNVFTLTHSLQLPFGTNAHFLNQGIVGRILGPWELNGILRYASGLPFTPTASAAQCMCPGNTPTANVTPGPGYVGFYPSYFGYLVPYYFSSYSFTQPAPGTLGDVGRNSLRGPDFWNYDLAVSRSFLIGEGIRMEVRAEGYNIANSVHFGPPVANVNSPIFGESTSTAPGLDARVFQFALKLIF